MIRVMDMSSGESCDENLHEFGVVEQTNPLGQPDMPRPQLQLAMQEVLLPSRAVINRGSVLQRAAR